MARGRDHMEKGRHGAVGLQCWGQTAHRWRRGGDSESTRDRDRSVASRTEEKIRWRKERRKKEGKGKK
jgi:hypothetical protein